ncbi:MAG: aminotransferase class I/II-fold pyridoxal phosphate-dependent enzyme [Pseudomonadota bacterium]
MPLSARSATAPFIAMDILAEAGRLEAEGRDIVHMEVGEPAYGAPRAAREALAKAQGGLGYTGGLGLPALREAIAALYARRYGIALPADRIVVTAGSSAGFVLAFLALFDAGARVALADPGYPAYRNILGTLGLTAVRIEATPETRYQPTPALLSAAAAEGAIDGLILASPSNPTGTMLDAPTLAALIDACAASGVSLVADEIYHGLTYDAPAPTALAHTDEVVVINSFSKYWAMTGWRIGWMVVPEAMVRPVQNLAQNLFICAPHPAQIAAIGALSEAGEAEAATHMAAYRANRERMIATLQTLGFTGIAPADGAFYAYASLPEGTPDSTAFCQRLLSEYGVAATPGLDFDPLRGNRTVRFSYAQSPERIEEGCSRLAKMMAAG